MSPYIYISLCVAATYTLCLYSACNIYMCGCYKGLCFFLNHSLPVALSRRRTTSSCTMLVARPSLARGLRSQRPRRRWLTTSRRRLPRKLPQLNTRRHDGPLFGLGTHCACIFMFFFAECDDRVIRNTSFKKNSRPRLSHWLYISVCCKKGPGQVHTVICNTSTMTTTLSPNSRILIP